MSNIRVFKLIKLLSNVYVATVLFMYLDLQRNANVAMSKSEVDCTKKSNHGNLLKKQIQFMYNLLILKNCGKNLIMGLF